MSPRPLSSTLLTVGRVTRRCDQCRTSFSIGAQMAFGEHAQRFCTSTCRNTFHAIRKTSAVNRVVVDCASCGVYAEGYRLTWLVVEMPLCSACTTVLRNSCWRKVSYPDPVEARGARIQRGHELLPMFVYQCELCSGWHRTKHPQGRVRYPGQRSSDDDAVLLVALRATLEGFGMVRGRDVVSLDPTRKIVT